MTALLELRGVSKQFGGIVALDDLDATVEQGAVTGLIGPNGAGKTTLFNVVSGVDEPDDGSIVFRGTDITGRPAHAICHAGIARTFQTPKPVRALTVEENLQVAARFGTPGGGVGADVSTALLEVFGLEDERDTKAGRLQLMQQKSVDVARALMTDPELLLVDELMAGLNPAEKTAVIEAVRRVHEEFGVDFVLVEHDLRAIRAVADTVIVVNEGQLLSVGAPDEVLAEERVRRAYVGS